jgi:hypothetical protein
VALAQLGGKRTYDHVIVTGVGDNLCHVDTEFLVLWSGVARGQFNSAGIWFAAVDAARLSGNKPLRNGILFSRWRGEEG